jgi:hypothetical protein
MKKVYIYVCVCIQKGLIMNFNVIEEQICPGYQSHIRGGSRAKQAITELAQAKGNLSAVRVSEALQSRTEVRHRRILQRILKAIKQRTVANPKLD